MGEEEPLERASGDSRRWRAMDTKEPDLIIKSTLEVCQMEEYLDLIVKHTQNQKDIFLKLTLEDLKTIGIPNKDRCKNLMSYINNLANVRKKKYDVKLYENEAVQIIKNFNEDITNINLGMQLFMDDLIANKLENFFVSQYNTSTSVDDALEFIRSTKEVYVKLVHYAHEKQILSDKELNTILNNLDNSYQSQLRRKKLRKTISWSLVIGSALLACWYFNFR